MKYLFSQRLWLLCLVVLLSAAGRVAAQAPGWAWATSARGAQGTSSVVDADGNVYVTGSFPNQATFGTTILTTRGLADIFVTKLNSSGGYEWAVRAGSGNNDYGCAVAVDTSGNVYVTGRFRGTAIFSPTIQLTTSNFYDDVFVAKLTSAGVWQWATSAGGSRDELSSAVVVDARGSVIVTGNFFSPTAAFGPWTLTNASASSGGSDIFVAKITSVGTWQWAASAGGADNDLSSGVAVGRNDSLVITGIFRGAVVFGSIPLLSVGSDDIFVAKITPAGAWQWATSAISSGSELSIGVAVDSNDNVAITGVFHSSIITFGTTVLNNSNGGYWDVFVAKLTPRGAWTWAVGAGGRGNDYSSGVAVDNSGEVYVTGKFQSASATFGTTTLTNATATYPEFDIFVTKLTQVGAWQWATSAGGSAPDAGESILVDGSNVVITGSFGSTMASFGSTTLTNPTGGHTIFIARLGTVTGLPEGAAPPPFTLAPNPAHSTATLTGLPAGSTATLHDALGRGVRTVPVTEGAATLDVRGLPAGLYFVQAGGAVRRLVVE